MDDIFQCGATKSTLLVNYYGGSGTKNKKIYVTVRLLVRGEFEKRTVSEDRQRVTK